MPTDVLPNVSLTEALDAMPQQIAILGKDAIITHANRAWMRFTDSCTPLYAKLGTDYLNVCKDAHDTLRSAEEVQPDHIYRGLYNVLEGVSDQFTLEYSCLTDLDERWFVMHIRPLHAGGAVVSHTDITSRRRYELEMERVAYTDALTDLPNRRAFFERAKQTIASAKRHARELHLLYIDLDGFKQVNDTLGHDAGDTLLVEVAARFKSQMRESDLLARLGGDEFACLLEVFHDDDIAQVAARYAACLDLPFRIAGEEVCVRASIGVARFPQEGSALQTLLKGADSKMYENKRSESAKATTVDKYGWVSHEEGSRPS